MHAYIHTYIHSYIRVGVYMHGCIYTSCIESLNSSVPVAFSDLASYCSRSAEEDPFTFFFLLTFFRETRTSWRPTCLTSSLMSLGCKHESRHVKSEEPVPSCVIHSPTVTKTHYHSRTCPPAAVYTQYSPHTHHTYTRTHVHTHTRTHRLWFTNLCG